MKLVKWILGGILGGAAIVSMAACATPQPDSSKNLGPQGQEGAASSVNFALTGGSFDGNSVFISGHRDGNADGKFPCKDFAKGCFNFPNGSHGIPVPVAGVDFSNLCPTVDVNGGDGGGTGEWTFTYTIFNGPNCTGTEITGENFTCFGEDDLASQQHPNETANEVLPPGVVVNTVICVSENTEKSFDFNSCAQIPNPTPPLPAGDKEFDCGCTRTGTAACSCPWFAVQHVNTPPPGCRFDDVCHLVCETETGTDGGVCACDDTFLPVFCTSNKVTYPNLCFAQCAGATGCAPVCACDDTFAPVFCTSTGQTYANQCIANCENATGCGNVCACTDEFNPQTCLGPDGTEVEYANPCFAACAGASQCHPTFPSADGGVCACDDTFLPVTCSNGVTYPNLCVANCAGATGCHETAPDAGPCACDDTYLPVTCSNGEEYANLCVANCAGATGCVSLCACDDTFIPVICDNGIVYANACVAACAGITDPTATNCHTAPAQDGGVCACDLTFAPVVCERNGEQGIEYANLCFAFCAGAINCVPLNTTTDGGVCACDDTFLPVICNGTEFANICVAHCAGATNCNNKCACDDTFNPVTCSNGETYANQCIANCEGATGCNKECACPDTFIPVTCSDGNVYANQCVADCAGATGCHQDP
jgi:hypothetical protein